MTEPFALPCVWCQGSGVEENGDVCHVCNGDRRSLLVGGDDDTRMHRTEVCHVSKDAKYVVLFVISTDSSGGMVGQGFIEGVPILPETPYIVLWTFTGQLSGAFVSESEGREHFQSTVEWHESTHEFPTTDGLALIYAPSPDSVTVLEDQDCVGRIGMNDAKWARLEDAA